MAKQSSKQGYKATRTTVVLALHSHYLESIVDKGVLVALSNVVGANYDLLRVPQESLEAVYAHFDDEITSRVRGEYEFVPVLGNIRDNKSPIACCSLCGKGDSRDDGANEDHIRYEFRLTNTAGGEDVWCGSTCILNHSLKVRGAETGEEARKLLAKSFREQLTAWKHEAWRAENPDHEQIPEQWETGRFRSVGRLCRQEFEVALLGFAVASLIREHRDLFGGFRTGGAFRSVTRFYARKSFLSESKTEVWRRAARHLRALAAIDRALLDAQGLTGEERFDFLRERGQTLHAPVVALEDVETRVAS